MSASTVDAVVAPVGAAGDYRALADQIRAAGLLERRASRYSPRIALTGTALLCGWAGLFLLRDSWAVLVVAAFLAAIFVQIVFVGHDAGHQQVFRSRRANRILGLTAGNALTGLSFGWWVPKHNAHHTHPNQTDRDPDIGAGVIAFTAEIAERRHGVGRVLARWQAWLFFPLLTLEGVALHVASIRTLIHQRDRSAVIEGLLMVAHAVVYLGLIFWLLSPAKAIAFVVVQQGLFGLYLGCSFAPNHKGMPVIERDSEESFFSRQVMTSRNVTGGYLTALLLGGLNYQIEHHLFPTMPSANLPKSQVIVREFCRTNGVSYAECGLISSYRQALTYLGSVGSGGLAPVIPG
jgi:fatty acid desaturase